MTFAVLSIYMSREERSSTLVDQDIFEHWVVGIRTQTILEHIWPSVYISLAYIVTVSAMGIICTQGEGVKRGLT